MDIPATAATPQAAATRSRGSLTSDFDTFLTLMTTQLQHQDPLKPVDSTEYLSQLASFSTVEQQSYTNNLLETLIASFGGMGLSQAAAWVGREARGIMPAHVAGPEAIPIFPSISPSADRAVLVVRNEAGDVVNRIDLAVGKTEFSWLPQDMTGAELPEGLYSFEVENYQGDMQQTSSAVELYGRVTEVRALLGGMVLMVDGGRELAAGSLTAIRG